MLANELIVGVDQHHIQDSTKVIAMMTCPRMYFYDYVLGWRPDIPNNHLVFGSAWHKAMEVFYTKGFDSANVMEAYKEFLAEYRPILGPETDALFHPKTPDNAFLVLAYYARQYSSDQREFKTLHVEVGGRVSLNADQHLFFKMDTICEGPRGKFSLEHKTAGSFYKWDEQWPLSMQVGTYTHVLHCMYPDDDIVGVIMNGVAFKKAKKAWEELNAGQKLSVLPPYEFHRLEALRSRPQMHNWMWTAQYWLDQIQHNFEWLQDCKDSDPLLYSFPMNSTNCTKYNGCQWQDYCNSWMNPLQRCTEPPLGFMVEHWDPTKEDIKTIVDVAEGEVTITEVETPAESEQGE